MDTSRLSTFSFFFFNDTATTEIYTLSLHDALPISRLRPGIPGGGMQRLADEGRRRGRPPRSEEHTSELQSQSNLVCRLLLEKKKKKTNYATFNNITPLYFTTTCIATRENKASDIRA